MENSIFIKILAVILICICGCAGPRTEIQKVTKTSSPNGAVVGRVSFAQFSENYTIKIEELDRGNLYTITEKDGLWEWERAPKGYTEKFFCKDLPPGRYSITSIEVPNPSPAPYRTDFRFFVEPFKASCIGTLIYNLAQMQFGMQTDNFRFFSESFGASQNMCRTLNTRKAYEDLIHQSH